MHWKTKAKIFRVLSAAPFGDRAHYFMQRHVTKTLPRDGASAAGVLAWAQRLQQEVQAVGSFDFASGRFLEIGAGRDLSLAVALRLLGSGPVVCLDITRLAKLEMIEATATRLARKLWVKVPRLKTWGDVAAFGITYLAPSTVADAAIEPESFDCFYTRSVLEHIPPADLQQVLARSSQLLKPGGVSVHCVDYTDHYAGPASPVSRFNFLKFDERGWRPYNSGLQYVNRLRHSEVLGMFASAGFRVLKDDAQVRPPEQAVCKELADQFKRFELGDLFTSESTIVARRPGL